MKNKISKISLFLILLFIPIFAGVEYLDLSASASEGNIIIKWKTVSETNFKNFVIERKTVNGNWADIGIVQPKSDKNYEYVDKNVYRSTAGNLYTYRIRFVDNDNTFSHSNEFRVVNFGTSGIKKTWGSIKALFR